MLCQKELLINFPDTITKLHFPCVARLVISQAEEQEMTLLSRFVQEFWLKTPGEGFTLNFVPMVDCQSLLIAAPNQKRLNEILDWTFDMLKAGLERTGCQVSEEN